MKYLKFKYFTAPDNALQIIQTKELNRRVQSVHEFGSKTLRSSRSHGITGDDVSGPRNPQEMRNAAVSCGTGQF